MELSQSQNCVVTHVDPIHNENAQRIHENAANCDYWNKVEHFNLLFGASHLKFV